LRPFACRKAGSACQHAPTRFFQGGIAAFRLDYFLRIFSACLNRFLISSHLISAQAMLITRGQA